MIESPRGKRWSVEIFHVLDHDRQQRVLEAFRDMARPDITALGTQSGRDWFVMIETSTVEDRFLARTTVTVIDTSATRAYSFKTPDFVGPLEPRRRGAEI